MCNLRGPSGEIHAICGENGAGKSTLMKVLSGVYPYGTYSGSIVYQGAETRFADIKASEHAGIVIIHQELALVRDVRSPRTSSSATSRASAARSTGSPPSSGRWSCWRRVGLQEDPDTLIKDIGVGKQQLVEIAKAFAKDVKLLILDEPTAALNEADSSTCSTCCAGFRSAASPRS
jgi:putative multiple sugar transport system ATP-binding protein